jgi:hypothetical protein
MRGRTSRTPCPALSMLRPISAASRAADPSGTSAGEAGVGTSGGSQDHTAIHGESRGCGSCRVGYAPPRVEGVRRSCRDGLHLRGRRERRHRAEDRGSARGPTIAPPRTARPFWRSGAPPPGVTTPRSSKPSLPTSAEASMRLRRGDARRATPRPKPRTSDLEARLDQFVDETFVLIPEAFDALGTPRPRGLRARGGSIAARRRARSRQSGARRPSLSRAWRAITRSGGGLRVRRRLRRQCVGPGEPRRGAFLPGRLGAGLPSPPRPVVGLLLHDRGRSASPDSLWCKWLRRNAFQDPIESTHHEQDWKSRIVSPDDAMALMKSGMKVYIHGACASPTPLLEAMVAQSRAERRHVCTTSTWGEKRLLPAPNTPSGSTRSRSLPDPMCAASSRAVTADFVPIFLSEIPALFKSGE